MPSTEYQKPCPSYSLHEIADTGATGEKCVLALAMHGATLGPTRAAGRLSRRHRAAARPLGGFPPVRLPQGWGRAKASSTCWRSSGRAPPMGRRVKGHSLHARVRWRRASAISSALGGARLRRGRGHPCRRLWVLLRSLRRRGPLHLVTGGSPAPT